MKKRERGRTILTTQRYGEDLPETVIQLDADTGIITAQGDLKAVIELEKQKEILAVIADGEELTETDIKDRIGGTQGLISKAVRTLFEAGKLRRTGKGRRGNPFLYGKVNLENPLNPKNPVTGES